MPKKNIAEPTVKKSRREPRRTEEQILADETYGKLDLSTNSLGAAFDKAGLGTTGTAVLVTAETKAIEQDKKEGTKAHMNPEIEEMVALIQLNFVEKIAPAVEDLHNSAQRDLELMAHYQKVEADWKEICRRIDAAKVAYDIAIKPLLDKLEGDRKAATPKDGTWLTFERSKEISEMITMLKSHEAFEKAIPELVELRELLRPEYEEALEFFDLNTQRKEARKAGK